MTFSEQAASFISGRNRLFGILHVPERPVDTAVVLLVGGPQYRVGSHRMFVQIARELARQGLAVFRFDFAGMGDSDGAFAGFENVDGDVAAALDYVKAECAAKRFVLLGLCDGATAAAYYAPTDARVAALILLNPWVHSEVGEAKAYMWHYYPRRLFQKDFWVSALRGGVRFKASFQDLMSKARRSIVVRPIAAGTGGAFVSRMRDALAEFRGKVLVMASENDLTAAEFMEIWNKDSSWRRIRESAVVVRLDGADHTLSSSTDLRRFLLTVSEWLPVP